MQAADHRLVVAIDEAGESRGEDRIVEAIFAAGIVGGHREQRLERVQRAIDEVKAVADLGSERIRIEPDCVEPCPAGTFVEQTGRAGIGIGFGIAIDQAADLEGISGRRLAIGSGLIVRREGQDRLARKDEQVAGLRDRIGKAAIVQIVPDEAAARDRFIVVGIDAEAAAAGQAERPRAGIVREQLADNGYGVARTARGEHRAWRYHDLVGKTA